MVLMMPSGRGIQGPKVDKVFWPKHLYAYKTYIKHSTPLYPLQALQDENDEFVIGVCVCVCVCVLSLLQLNCQACPVMSPICQSRETSNCTPQTLQLLAGEWVRTMQIDKKGNALHEKPIYDSATDCVHPETLLTAMEVSLTASFVNFITFLLECRA
jgi:hypothetical protein